ncbi:hypothetical protein OBP_103 [Pseudomonas phage OBP]|uniref:hypothetical protein n=1 Tax=Pseudomonas phage OBP TaxID=1124849 RepID=UPI000240D495|nr:hypothetical protein OBP_103 [Pseudomonas phage OBP]AEV89540.1 hypothetical protein OBP_103 [Pseudomonas phage OBP]
MQKEDLYALIDQLTIDQERYNKFKDYTLTFVRDKRCRKGALAFVEEVFNLPQISGRDELALRLFSEKSLQNSRMVEDFIFTHPITIGYSEALKTARLDLMKKVGEYIIDISRRLTESEIADKDERQVYLRRAVARLYKVSWRRTQVTIQADQWHEVEPEDIPYLTETLDELTNRISDTRRFLIWSDQYGDSFGLDDEKTLKSLRTYLDYLDTYLEY